jgi:hypothetical protein
MSAGGPRHASG